MRLMKEKVILKTQIDPIHYQKNLCLVSDRVDDPYRIYDVIQKRKDLDYAIYSENLLLSFAESPFTVLDEGVMNALMVKLASILYDDVVGITFLINELWAAFQHEAPFSELMNLLIEEGAFEALTKREVEAFIPTLIDFTNAIPMWILKGHSPDSLHAKRIPTKQEPTLINNTVGRNDLCPCGSGRKYKKCCGAN